MTDKLKDIVLTIAFFTLIIGMFFLNIINKDTEISISERRKLAKFPEISIKVFRDNKFSNQFEKYAMDQFTQREEFRALKTFAQFNIFMQKDNNDLYILNDSIVKIQKDLNQKSIVNASYKINEVYLKYLKNTNAFYTIIPDKNYYASKISNYPTMDYELLKEIMNKEVKNIEFIDIFDCLDFNSFYRTDTHWKQESLEKVVDKISGQMGFKDRLSKKYEINQIDNFYGVYYGELLDYKIKPETIKYFTNKQIEESTVYNFETSKNTKVYDLEKINNIDKYDIFLSGASAILTIINENANTDKELIVFRDSFASSVVPLFIEAYRRIDLIDLRYVSSSKLEEFVKFDAQDVIFMFSTLIINNSYSLK